MNPIRFDFPAATLTALADALHPDPFYAALTPDASADPATWRDSLRAYFGYALVEARAYGKVELIAEQDGGAALWLLPQAPGVAETLQQTKNAALEKILAPRGFENYRAIIAAMTPYAERVAPPNAWYLSILGVAPPLQNQGLGAKLIAVTLAQAAQQFNAPHRRHGHSYCPDSILNCDTVQVRKLTLLLHPRRVLQNHAVPVRVLERFAARIPIRIKRRNGFVPMRSHAFHPRAPFRFVGQIKHNQIVLRWRASHVVSVRVCKFKMVRRARFAQHDAVETFMVLKRRKHIQAQTIAIKFYNFVHAVRRPRHAQMRKHEFSFI